MRERHIDPATHVVSKFSDFNQFLAATTLPAGLLTISVNGLPIDLLNVPKKSDTTIVFLHGAIEPHFKIPVLSGQGISAGLTANRVFISDPALQLSEKLLLAWYAGNSAHPDGQMIITAIVEKLLESHGAKRVIFFGGSGGGFASLYFASHFENSMAFAYNPQTDLTQYNARAIHEFTQYAHSIHRREYDPIQFLPPTVTTNVCMTYAMKRPTTIAYFQNLNDHTHVNRQLRPFLDKLHPENNMFLLAKPWGAGHTAPPKEVLRKALHEVSDSADWDGALKSNGFQTIDPTKAAEYAEMGIPGTFVSPNEHSRSRFSKYDKK